MKLQVLPSSLFTYSKATKSFSTCITDLPALRSSQFYIKSVKTGETRLFMYEKHELDKEGDTVAFHFFCPGEGYKLVIFND